MKIRTDFVANSSSCSFTCDICGYSRYDMDHYLIECGWINWELKDKYYTICPDCGEELSKVIEYYILGKKVKESENKD